MDIEQTITEYLQHLEGLGHAATTMASGRDNLKFFVGYLKEKGVTDLLQVTGCIMADYKQQVMATTLAITTKQKRLRIVVRLFTWLENKNALLINPAEGLTDTIWTGRRIMPILTALEVQKLMAQPDLSTNIGLRNRAIMELFYSSGLRRSELCGLKAHDLDLDGRVVTVRRDKGGKDRMVPVGTTACYYLNRYLAEVRPTFVGKNPMNESLFLTHQGATLAGGTVKDFLRIYSHKAGITKQRGSHILRRSCASHMLSGGADLRSIQELLGHKHLHTTQLYTFIAPIELKEAHRKYHPGKDL